MITCPLPGFHSDLILAITLVIIFSAIMVAATMDLVLDITVAGIMEGVTTAADIIENRVAPWPPPHLPAPRVLSGPDRSGRTHAF